MMVGGRIDGIRSGDHQHVVKNEKRYRSRFCHLVSKGYWVCYTQTMVRLILSIKEAGHSRGRNGKINVMA